MSVENILQCGCRVNAFTGMVVSKCAMHRPKAPPLPKWPEPRIVKEDGTHFCETCNSTAERKYIFFGPLVCINPHCPDKHRSKDV